MKKMKWKPVILWTRFSGIKERNAQFYFPPQPESVGEGSCHRIRVIYLRANGAIFKRLIKFAKDKSDDNRQHFESEQQTARYISKMARVVNREFSTRTNVCIWPVETILFRDDGEYKWGMIQPPFIHHSANFEKTDPNSGAHIVDDATVGRYQHAFTAIAQGLKLVRDWQGYRVLRKVFREVCDRFNVDRAAVSHVVQEGEAGKTEVLVLLDPVLVTHDAHYGRDDVNFGIEAMEEWKENHECIRCRCQKQFHLLSSDELQFGIGDPGQRFFDRDALPNETMNAIRKCRRSLDHDDKDPTPQKWPPGLGVANARKDRILKFKRNTGQCLLSMAHRASGVNTLRVKQLDSELKRHRVAGRSQGRKKDKADLLMEHYRTKHREEAGR